MTRREQVVKFGEDWCELGPSQDFIDELSDLVEAAFTDGLTQGREEMRSEILSAIEELGAR